MENHLSTLMTPAAELTTAEQARRERASAPTLRELLPPPSAATFGERADDQYATGPLTQSP